MRIRRTIERECCDPVEDLRSFYGEGREDVLKNKNPRFCIQCGQLWYEETNGAVDEKGSKEVHLRKVKVVCTVGNS